MEEAESTGASTMLQDVAWSNVIAPLVICTWLMLIITAKIAFHGSKINRFVPESALLIVFGLVVGLILDHIWRIDLHLVHELFFLYLLPPIALDAGYFLPFRAFFKNIGTILLYAVFGTILNILSIFGILNLIFSDVIPSMHILLFSTLISAVDPVAVLSVFEEIHVNEMLYINVFGESLLNDAVVIVLYHTVQGIAMLPKIDETHILDAALLFTTVSVGGIVLGLLFVVITAIVTKMASGVQVVQPLICLLLPYLCYLLCELVHISGIIAIVTCGLLMKTYVHGNLNDKTKTTTSVFMKTMCHTCEAIVFLLLGVSVFSKSHNWDLYFAGVTVASCFFVRFVVVFLLTNFVNKYRVKKIAIVDQLIIGYGGLRGAICYGLVQALDDNIPAKDMFITTTVVVICFTVFVQGTTIKPLVDLLRVERQPPAKKTLMERVQCNFTDDLMAGIEGVVGTRGSNFYRRRFSTFNHKILEPNLTVSPSSRGHRLVERVCELATEEQRRKLIDDQPPF